MGSLDKCQGKDRVCVIPDPYHCHMLLSGIDRPVQEGAQQAPINLATVVDSTLLSPPHHSAALHFSLKNKSSIFTAT